VRSSEDEADAHANEQRRNVAAVAVARVLMREIEIDRESGIADGSSSSHIEITILGVVDRDDLASLESLGGGIGNDGDAAHVPAAHLHKQASRVGISTLPHTRSLAREAASPRREREMLDSRTRP